MLIPEQIIYSIRLLREKNIYPKKTTIQNILFLASNENDLFYIPYPHGPYSKEVQLTLQSMIKKGIISYDLDNGLNIKSYAEQLYDNQIIKKVIDFLLINEYHEDNKISLFSKVFYFYTKNKNKDENKIKNIIEDKGIFIWEELNKLDNNNLEKLLKNSVLLSNTLS